MAFHSILYEDSESSEEGGARDAPECFRDLNLDQIVASVVAGRDEYDLTPFFYSPLSSSAAIAYRQDILRDLEDAALLLSVRSFSEQMRAMRKHLAQADKLHYPFQKQRWFLEAADIYGNAARRLAEELGRVEPQSRGMLALRDYLADYVRSAQFTKRLGETQRLKADLAVIRYSLHIKDNCIRVSRYEGQADYGEEVLRAFERFKQGAAKEYQFPFYSGPDMNHVEAAVLEMVTKLYPSIFTALSKYCQDHRDFLDGTVVRFDREVQFYLAWIEHLEPLEAAGLPFCYPAVSADSKEVHGREIFDLALAGKFVAERRPVVANDFCLKDRERIFVVSGANQGGKTTFGRAFGQLHYLARLGCRVPGRDARLFLCDRLFTHFEREEDLRNLSSKLEDDLLRIKAILAQATAKSILIMNESFASTTLSDALFLSRRLLDDIIRRNMICLSVTFLDELASLGETIVSMVAAVDPGAPRLRTFKIARKPAEGLAYATAIAEKYRLTGRSIRERISP